MTGQADNTTDDTEGSTPVCDWTMREPLEIARAGARALGYAIARQDAAGIRDTQEATRFAAAYEQCARAYYSGAVGSLANLEGYWRAAYPELAALPTYRALGMLGPRP